MVKLERTIIIVGGSVAALSLANMLEKAGIRYIILEAYDEIAPQVGASICVQANGLRILDQLDCADKLISLVDRPIHDSWVRNYDGSILRHHANAQNIFTASHGYPSIFIDRQMLLQILYEKLNNKDSVLTGQKVVSVAELENGVQVTTAKGDVFKGDMVVGADGIYSTVRNEMWRIANNNSPGYFPDDEWSSDKDNVDANTTSRFEPLTGHGGNCAIETAATLFNHLIEDVGPDWSTADLNAAFKTVQDERVERVKWLVADAHKNQQMQAMATPLLAIMAPVLVRLITTPIAFQLSSQKFIGAPRINSLPVPKRDHTFPYDDELFAKPLLSGWLTTSLGIFSQAALFRLASQILPRLKFPTTFGSEPLLRNYTGIKVVDKILTILVAVFGVPLTSNRKASLIQLITFTPLLLSSTLDWTIESYRDGSQGLLTSFPSIFGAIYQLKGIGQIAPLYHMISVCEQGLTGSTGTVAGHPIAKSSVEAIIPGIGLGFVVPTALMLWPFKNAETRQKLIALWQPFPLHVSLIVAGVSGYLRKRNIADQGTESKTDDLRERRETTRSVLDIVYKVGAAGAALIHFWSLYRILRSEDLTFSDVFGDLRSLVSKSYGPTIEDGSIAFFQRDMFLNALSVVTHSIYRTLDLRRLGYITTKEAVSTVLASLAMQPVFGPAAVHMGFLGWREEMFARMSRRISA
ncbi:zeaxanthin chloroplastic [Fusarium heterosporum]|uniref:Zeaxanthin chloroplastic n=1 Tax=Fusarium heterosporum TaxID=42747 RepID=A0A8H5X3R3_FUSHE|nr:zeaxanthin chloroplastic [Fusarium heterosporum]